MNRATKTLIKRISLWGGFVVFIGGLVWILAQTPSPALQSSNALASAINAADWVSGNSNAQVTVIEYGDFQCPACAAYAPLVEKLMAEYQDRVLFAYRHFPLSQHKNALPTAYAAEAAGQQGQFWEMANLIYDNQKTWENLPSPESQLELYASQLGLNLDKFRADSKSQAIKDKVQKDLAGGIAAEINHTPTFFVNLKQIPNPTSYDEFKSILDQALAGNS